MAKRLRAALHSTQPEHVSATLHEAELFGIDVANERRALEVHLSGLLDTALREMRALLQSDDERMISAALSKFADWASLAENVRIVVRDLRARREDLRGSIIRAVEGAMHCDDITTLDALRTTVLCKFGSDMEPYSEMLSARRLKLAEATKHGLRHALVSREANIETLDRVLGQSIPLLQEVDEKLWAQLRQHRDVVVKATRVSMRTALLGVDVVEVERLLKVPG